MCGRELNGTFNGQSIQTLQQLELMGTDRVVKCELTRSPLRDIHSILSSQALLSRDIGFFPLNQFRDLRIRAAPQ